MIFSWTADVVKNGELTIYNGISVGQWANVFTAALQSFKKNSGLKLKLTPVKSEASANVVMLLSEGNASYPYGGNNDPIIFSGTSAHGKTRMFRGDGGIEKVVSFLPANPTYNHVNYLRFIAVHELIHACGLDNDEHANDGVFMNSPNMGGGKIWASNDTKKMPPLFFSPKTQGKLRTYFS
jgi:hypothetical protein